MQEKLDEGSKLVQDKSRYHPALHPYLQELLRHLKMAHEVFKEDKEKQAAEGPGSVGAFRAAAALLPPSRARLIAMILTCLSFVFVGTRILGALSYPQLCGTRPKSAEIARSGPSSFSAVYVCPSSTRGKIRYRCEAESISTKALAIKDKDSSLGLEASIKIC